MLKLKENRTLDFITLGRAGIDLYASQENKDFEEVTSFKKYIGGSPANIAVALARRGARTGCITKVAQDATGKNVIHYLQSQNVETSQISLDTAGKRTSLALTEMRPRNCNVTIYRNQAADLALAPGDISKTYIASAGALLISGTALSASPSREAAFTAAHYARLSGTKVILDIDHRSFGWETPTEAPLYYRLMAERCHIIIGNREEFDVLESFGKRRAGRTSKKDRHSASELFAHQAELVIIKHGKKGFNAFTKDGKIIEGKPFPAPRIRKPFGAGDAFAGNLLYELMQETPLEESLQRGAAAASIVIGGDACSDSSPTGKELDRFMEKYHNFEEAL